MTEVEGKVLPAYFVADESSSMTSVTDQLNNGLKNLLDTLRKNPFNAAMVRLAILGFSDSAKCHLDLSDWRHVETLPKLGAYNSTSYDAVFRELHRRIPGDIAKLKRENYLVTRPAVFFLTDGAPNANEPWREALAKLKSPEFRERPNILAFGIGEAVPRVILEVASNEKYAYVAAKETDVGKALEIFFDALIRSIVNTTQALAAGKSEVPLEKPEGFTLALDLL